MIKTKKCAIALKATRDTPGNGKKTKEFYLHDVSTIMVGHVCEALFMEGGCEQLDIPRYVQEDGFYRATLQSYKGTGVDDFDGDCSVGRLVCVERIPDAEVKRRRMMRTIMRVALSEKESDFEFQLEEHTKVSHHHPLRQAGFVRLHT